MKKKWSLLCKIFGHKWREYANAYMDHIMEKPSAPEFIYAEEGTRMSTLNFDRINKISLGQELYINNKGFITNGLGVSLEQVYRSYFVKIGICAKESTLDDPKLIVECRKWIDTK